MCAQIAPGARKVRFDEMEREGVVAGRDGRVRREDGAAPDLVERVIEARAALAEIANALQDDERRMTLVEVIRRWRDAERLQDADATDAEDDLLLHARLA